MHWINDFVFSKVSYFYYFAEKKDQTAITQATEYIHKCAWLWEIFCLLDIPTSIEIILPVCFKLNWLSIGIFWTTFWVAKN